MCALCARIILLSCHVQPRTAHYVVTRLILYKSQTSAPKALLEQFTYFTIYFFTFTGGKFFRPYRRSANALQSHVFTEGESHGRDYVLRFTKDRRRGLSLLAFSKRADARAAPTTFYTGKARCTPIKDSPAFFGGHTFFLCVLCELCG